MVRMNVKITGTDFDQIAPEFKKNLDTALARTLTLQQGEIAKANPKDTGRMASSWFVSQNSPERGVRPSSWGAPGAKNVQLSLYPENAITFDGTWFISNSLPYAAPICLLGNYPPSWGGSAPSSIPGDWYTSIANQTTRVFSEQFDKAQR